MGRSDPRCWEGQRGGRKRKAGEGEAVKCTNGGRKGGRASGTAELQRFTYPRVYRQLNEAQLGMQILPLGHFLQRKCEVQPDRSGKRRNAGREAERGEKRWKDRAVDKSRRHTVKRGTFSFSARSRFHRHHADKATVLRVTPCHRVGGATSCHPAATAAQKVVGSEVKARLNI